MADDLTALNRRLYREVFDEGQPRRDRDLVAEDAVDHMPLLGQGPGRQGFFDQGTPMQRLGVAP